MKHNLPHYDSWLAEQLDNHWQGKNIVGDWTIRDEVSWIDEIDYEEHNKNKEE